MATYVYRRQVSDSARELAMALGATRYRGTTYPIERKVRPGDVVIAWGESLPALNQVRTLNGGPIRSKYDDAVALRLANVNTIEVARQRPAPIPIAPATDPAVALFREALETSEEFGNLAEIQTAQLRLPPFRAGLTALMASLTSLNQALDVPAPIARVEAVVDWVGRNNDHVGGNDLLNPTTNPAYYSKKENFVQEFRIHSFLGRSIRAGVKVPREDMTPHAWVRSWDGGWRMNYDGVTAQQAHRIIAHQACQALNLDFGAVDIGEKADGTLVVLEVNRAPGLEGGTITRYAGAINRWMSGEWTATNLDETRPARRAA